MGRMKSTQLGNFQPIILRIFQSVLTSPQTLAMCFTLCQQLRQFRRWCFFAYQRVNRIRIYQSSFAILRWLYAVM